MEEDYNVTERLLSGKVNYAAPDCLSLKDLNLPF